jgi:hypothetical protein
VEINILKRKYAAMLLVHRDKNNTGISAFKKELTESQGLWVTHILYKNNQPKDDVVHPIKCQYTLQDPPFQTVNEFQMQRDDEGTLHYEKQQILDLINSFITTLGNHESDKPEWG